jgi:hypothetical protein
MGSDNDGAFALNSLRDPSEVMQPERLGALKQTPLSFVRLLVKRMVDERWEIGIERSRLDERGVGRVVYSIDTPSMRFSFGVFSRVSSEGENTDRIIATEWDLWAFLCEGEAPPELMDGQYEELPHVLEGRATPEVLIWTRANRSSRFFGHVVDSLAAGHQPDVEFLGQGGYLMRSSGYYGNGLNGTKVFEAMGPDHPLERPYMAQMLAAYMLRVFGYDLAEEMAAARSDDAVTLDEDVKRYLGTGNSSGVGIILYVINHPRQINAWLRAREIALARVKATEPTAADLERFRDRLSRAERWFHEDESDTGPYFLSKDRIATGIDRVRTQLERLERDAGTGARPDGDTDTRSGAGEGRESLWSRLCAWAAAELETESQEVLHALLLDTYPEVCEGLEKSLITSERSDLTPQMSLSELRALLRSEYGWALDIDFDRPGSRRFFWYRAVESEEPRMGVRGEHDYEEYSRPVDIAYRVQRLAADLADAPGDDTVAEFLFEHPEHRFIVERAQHVGELPYAEIRGNPLDADFVPLYFIACLKSFWGISKTHPKSMGWVRGTFFQGAPTRAEIRAGRDDYWVYPPMPERAPHWRDD